MIDTVARENCHVRLGMFRIKLEAIQNRIEIGFIDHTDQTSNTKQETVEIGWINGTYMNTRPEGGKPRGELPSAYSCADLR